MKIEEFNNQKKVAATTEYLKQLLDKYLKSITVDTKNGYDFDEVFNVDFKNVKAGNQSGLAQFLVYTVGYDYVTKKQQIQSPEVLTKEEKYKYLLPYKQELLDLNEIIRKVDGRLLLSRKNLFGEIKNSKTPDVELNLNVDPDKLIEVVEYIYETIKTTDLDFYIAVSDENRMTKGYRDTISMVCHIEEIEKYIELLEKLPENIKASIGEPNEVSGKILDKVGYKTLDAKTGNDTSVLFGVSFIKAIDKAIEEFKATNALDLSEYSNDKNPENEDLRRKSIIYKIATSGYDISTEIVKKVVNELAANGFDLSDLYTSSNVREYIESRMRSIEVDVNEEIVIDLKKPEIIFEQELDFEPVIQTPEEIVPQVETVETMISQVEEKVPQVETVEPVISQVEEIAPQIEVVEQMIPQMEEMTVPSQILPQVNDEFTPVIEPINVPEINVENIEEKHEVSEDTLIDIKPLTSDEINALISDSNSEKIVQNKDKYVGIVSPEELDTVISLPDGSSETVYDYLEDYDVLSKIPANSIVLCQNERMRGYEFINERLIDYIKRNGAQDLDTIMGFYVNGIENLENRESFFQKFFN